MIKVAQNRGKFNKERGNREVILYKLMPFSSDADFNKALERNLVGEQTAVLQLRFDHWVSLFESQFGDILVFWNTLGDIEESQKLVIVNNLLTQIISKNHEQPKETGQEDVS